jgi:hypothetical protein
VVSPFADLADWMSDNLPDGAEKTTSLRKLLEAKDCAVRAAIEGREKREDAERSDHPG